MAEAVIFRRLKGGRGKANPGFGFWSSGGEGLIDGVRGLDTYLF